MFVGAFDARPFEGRLASYGSHRPFDPEAHPRPGAWEAAVSWLNAHPFAGKDAALRGVAELHDRRPDRAVTLLESTLADPAPAELSDLSAAYLARGKADGSMVDAARALDRAERSLALDPQSRVAAFNRALALERLLSLSQAERAWAALLTVEEDPGWRAEIRDRLERIRSRLEARPEQPDPPPTTEEEWIAAAGNGSAERRVRDDLLGRWADSVAGGNAREAARHLEAAARGAAIIARFSGDRRLLRAVEQLRLRSTADSTSACTETDPTAAAEPVEPVAAAWGCYAAARLRYAAQDLVGTVALLSFLPADKSLDRIATEPTLQDRAPQIPVDLLVVRGRSYWLRGLARQILGDLYRARIDLVVARDLLRRDGAPNRVAPIESLVADNLARHGMLDEQWPSRRRALDAAWGAGDARLSTVLGSTARALAAVDQWRAARRLQDEVVRLTEKSGDRRTLASTLRQRAALSARIHEQGGLAPEESADFRSAESDLDRARDLLAGVDDARLRQNGLAFVDLVAGRLYASSDPDRAITTLHRALAYFQATEARTFRPEIYLTLASASATAGDDPIPHLSSGIRDLEETAEWIPEAIDRASFLEESRPVYETLVRTLAGRGMAWGALEVAEGYRDLLLGTVPRDTDGESSATPRREAPAGNGLAHLADSLSPDAVVVSFFVAGSEVVAWRLDVTGLQSRVITRDSESLRAAVAATGRALASDLPRAEQDRRLAELYRLLVSPIAESGGLAERLIVVPDAYLHAVPFAALRDGNAGRYLVEDHSVIATPTVHDAVRVAARVTEGSSEIGPVLSVAVPEPPATVYGRPPPLPRAVAEARDVAALHGPDAQVWAGGTVTSDRFLAEITRFELLHFAGHAVGSPTVPARAALLLDRPPQGSNAPPYVTAAEIARLRLQETRVVILAACSTALGSPTASPWISSIAYPFLIAGAQNVVASLWPIGDAAAHELMVALHAELRSGRPVSTAIRNAQLHVLHSADRAGRPSSWAPYIALNRTPSRATSRRP